MMESGFARILAIAVGVIVVTATAALVLSEQASPATVESRTTDASPGAQVRTVYLTHLANMQSKNLSAVMGEYGPNATVVWKGVIIFGLYGTYRGWRVFSLYAEFLDLHRTSTFVFDNVTSSIAVTDDKALVNSTFVLKGTGNISANCKFTAPVTSNLTYVRHGDRWEITNETWFIMRILGSTCANDISL